MLVSVALITNSLITFHKIKGSLPQLMIFETLHVICKADQKDFEEFVCCVIQHKFNNNHLQ